ncbi:MAG: phosphoadenosine phosphosulfate reductase family protein [Candidatus Woesearchaeota archaeon]
MSKKDIEFLRKKQELPLKNKVMLTQIKIKHFYESFKGKVYLSFSGGKDSTVLKNIIEKMDLKLPVVFCNTGLEYPELVNFVKKNIENLKEYKEITKYGYTYRVYNEGKFVILKPKISYNKVLDKYGYPVISKEQSQYIYDYNNTNSEKMKDLRINGNKDGNFKISNKWKKLINAPFDVSSKCCDVMKKRPFKRYETETKRHPIVATMAEESILRKQKYLLNGGCNIYDSKRPISAPMSFWTEQDVLKYIKENNIKIAEVYGEIEKNEENKLTTTKADRTGCVFCMYGVHLEDEPNRFQRLKETHPKLYDYAINTLGLKEVLEFIDVPYE